VSNIVDTKTVKVSIKLLHTHRFASYSSFLYDVYVMEHFTHQLPHWELNSASLVWYTRRCTRHNYRTATTQCRACHQQTSTVTVINQRRLSSVWLATPRITPLAHRHGREPTWRMDTKVSNSKSDFQGH